MIVFKKIRFKNFGSFGNYWTEIALDATQSTLVVGSNGHGKSFALFDSITFALFGKPFRNINKPNLVNSINKKNCVVEVDFENESKSFKVIRGISPSVFEIYENGVLINQQAASKDYQQILEENILRLTYRSFCQVVILGSTNYVPFMQLPSADRRAVIEDLLDIQVFSVMNSILKDRMIESREQESTLRQEIAVSRARLEELNKSLRSMKTNDQDFIEKQQRQIETIMLEVESFQKDVTVLNEELALGHTQTNGKDQLILELNEFSELLIGTKKNLGAIEKSIQFFKTTDKCPTCIQPIASDFREKTLLEKQEKQQTNSAVLSEVQASIRELQDKVSEITKLEKQNQTRERKLAELNATIQTKQRSVHSLQESINNFRTNKQDSENDITTLVSENTSVLTELETKMNELRVEKQYQELASILLKDSGIKSRIVKKHLPTINKLINYYLSKLDFFVSFELDENFKETLKSRHRDDFLYTSFSQGEKMRIDLAILLTWREIARQKNKVNTNLLLLDEVFDSSLDSFGVDEFVKILTMLSTWNKDTNIFVITHRSDGFNDKFSNIIRFEKKNDFTYMNATTKLSAGMTAGPESEDENV